LIVHPILVCAARGELPEWAQAKRKRRAHIGRVADLMGSWAEVAAPGEVDRWRAAAWLHDALRDADVGELREHLGSEFPNWPPSLLHGPASAQRLGEEGVEDAALLDAVRYHTVGHAQLERIGQALYMADFLEPGRSYSPEWRALMRARMPERFDEVLREVALTRIRHLLERRAPIKPESSEFWNTLVRR